MLEKKYTVREGFVLFHTVKRSNNDKYEKIYAPNDEVVLTDADFKLHAHKLELWDVNERTQALAAEKAANILAQSNLGPVELLQNLVTAVNQAQEKADSQQAASAG